MARELHQLPSTVRDMPWSDFTDIERSFNKVHPLHEVMFQFAGGEIEQDEPGTIEDLAGVMGGI